MQRAEGDQDEKSTQAPSASALRQGEASTEHFHHAGTAITESAKWLKRLEGLI